MIIKIDGFAPIKVQSLEDYQLPGTSIKMLKITGNQIVERTYFDVENGVQKVVKEIVEEPVTIIINPNRINHITEE